MNQRSQFRSVTAFLILVTSVAACGGEPDANASKPMSDDEVVRLMEERGTFAEVAPATTPKAPYFWETWANEGNSPKATGATLAGHVCVMSGLGGDFGGIDGYAESTLFDQWVVKAGANQWVSNICARWSSFVGPANSVAWVSDQFTASLSSVSSNETAFREVTGWWGDAASFLTYVSGEYEGGGEYADITQHGNPRLASWVTVHTIPPTWPFTTDIAGGARSVFVGVPNSGRAVKLWGLKNNVWARGDANTPGLFELSVSTESGFWEQWLPPTDKALCYLTHVSGNFDGGAEAIQILVESNQWYIRALAASGKAIFGKARCMSWDQR